MEKVYKMEVTDKIRRASISWLLTIQEEHGNEVAMKCYDVMREGFGEDLAGAVLFGIMSNEPGNQVLRIRWTNQYSLNNKINAIKAARRIGQIGLGEAKTLIESCTMSEMTLKIHQSTSLSDVNLGIKELEDAGIDVR